jgi:hypothetical protein
VPSRASNADDIERPRYGARTGERDRFKTARKRKKLGYRVVASSAKSGTARQT